MKTIRPAIWAIFFLAFSASFAVGTGFAVDRPQSEDAPSVETLKLRGAWIWGTSCSDRASADKMLARAEMMNLNALYVLVFYWGATACYQSELAPMNSAVADGFDPLGYLIEHGHEKDIEIHAWFVNGKNTRTSGIFQQHPNWMAMNLIGRRIEWFDLYQEIVRDWQTELMLELLENYDVDGLHFDYIRFNGKDACTGPTCQAEAARDAGIDIAGLTYPELPAYGHYRGNPLAGPTTASVLAQFDNQVPAVAVNSLGSGEVILFNWHADINTPRAIHEAMARALVRLGAKDRVLVLDSDINAVRYGHRMYQAGRDWVEALGFQPIKITDNDLLRLSGGTVVLLPKHYLMTDAQAQALVGYVRNGGGALFLDGPVYALGKSAAARQLLGFQRSGGYFSSEHLLVARTAQDNFVPSGDHVITLGVERRKNETWDRWRKDQITRLVADVSQQARRTKPLGSVTAAVFSSESGAEAVLQDWPQWVSDGLLDTAIPMCYVDAPEKLDEAFAWWKDIDPELRRIVPGISLYKAGAGLPPVEHAARIAAQIDVCRKQNARGVVMFSMEHIEDATAKIVGETVFNRPDETTDGAVLSADFNGDRTVDFGDFILFAGHFGTAAGDRRYDPKFDLDGDGTVNFRDFLKFAERFLRQ